MVNLDAVLHHANLNRAWQKVQLNAGAEGADGQTIEEFGQNVGQQLAILREEVSSHKYKPRPLRRVPIPKSNGKGKRLLSIPSIRDRVLQTAVAFILTPVLDVEFEANSYAYRKGRSVKQAIKKISEYRSQGFRWVLDADIDDFFDNVSHKKLLGDLYPFIDDSELEQLIQQWLQAKVIHPDGELIKLQKGIPQGSPLSPLLANLFLDRLDEHIQQEELKIIRYADDFVILCKTRERVEDALELTREVLKELELTLNQEKTAITNFEKGFKFLGFEFDSQKIKKLPARKPETKPLGMMKLAFKRAGIEADDFQQKIIHKPLKQTTQSSLSKTTASTQTHLDPILETLYIHSYGAVLSKQYERFKISTTSGEIQTIPRIHINQIVIYGYVQITTQAMHYCLQEQIPIYLLSKSGRYKGIIDAFTTEPLQLHQLQMKRHQQNDFRLNLSRQFIHAKVHNTRTLLKRSARRHKYPALTQSIHEFTSVLRNTLQAKTLEQLMGYEGTAAKIYFETLKQLFGDDWGFNTREKNPPPDPINALLSYTYTLLFNNIYSLLKMQGLNPQIGLLHNIRTGHPALASDLIEEFRAPIADSIILNLLLNKKISLDDFNWSTHDEHACIIKTAARKLLITTMEKKLASAIIHPSLEKKIDYRRYIAHQARMLKECITNESTDYTALLIK